MRRFLVAGAVAILTACATSYVPNGIAGGFSDVRLDENVFRVSFQGNGFTKPDDAQQMLLLRCAEVTLAAGYRFFVIGQAQDTSQRMTQYAPAQVNTTSTVVGNQVYGTSTVSGGMPITYNFPSGTATIVASKERPATGGITYDAKFIVESLGPKFKKG